MATSTKQTVALVEVYDYVLAAGDPASGTSSKGLAGKKVKVTLAYDKQRSSSPITWLVEEPTYSALTDANGFWHVFVVPTDSMAVANSYYIVEVEGYITYKINPTLAGVPGIGWQSSAILLDIPASLTPAGQTVTGPLTVLGLVTASAGLDVNAGEPGIDTSTAGALLIADNNATSVEAGSGATPFALQGDVATRSLTVLPSGPYTPTAATGGADFKGAVRIDGGKPWFDVTHPTYGADPTGVADSATAINAAITAVPATGGVVYIPPGTYLCNSAINTKPNLVLLGAGKKASVLTTGIAGDLIKDINAINSSVAVHLVIQDLGLTCTNGANTGAAIDEVGGSFIDIIRVRTSGFKYGVIFDQTELGDVQGCDFEFPLSAGAWLTNGPDHTGGANVNRTNRIGFKRCQFNMGVAGTTGIADDGGSTHDIADCNFTAGLNAIRVAGAFGSSIRCCEFEAQTGASIVSTSTTFVLAGGVGGCYGLLIEANIIVPVAGQAAIQFLSGAVITVLSNQIATTVTALISLANVNTLLIIGNAQTGVGALFVTRSTRLVAQGNLDLTGSYANQITDQQTPTETVLVSGVNANLGGIVAVTLTAARTVGAPLNPSAGQYLTFIFTQDGTGGRLLTWNAVFKTAWQAIQAPSALSSVVFVYDGTNWQQVGGQIPVGTDGTIGVLGPTARILTSQATAPTVGSPGSGVSAQSVIAGGSNSAMQVQATLTAIAPGVVVGVVAFNGGPLATAPKNVVCSLSAPTAGVAAPPVVGADTYTTSGFTLRSYGPTTVTTGTYIITCLVFF